MPADGAVFNNSSALARYSPRMPRDTMRNAGAQIRDWAQPFRPQRTSIAGGKRTPYMSRLHAALPAIPTDTWTLGLPLSASRPLISCPAP